MLPGDKGRQRCDPPSGQRQGRDAEHPAESQSALEDCFSPLHAAERMFGRLKDFRPIARRYDRLAENSSPLSASRLPSATGYESGP